MLLPAGSRFIGPDTSVPFSQCPLCVEPDVQFLDVTSNYDW